MTVRYSSLVKPEGVWWHALGRDERLWLSIAVVWSLAMFVMIAFVWPGVGRQQNQIQTFRVEPAEFRARTEAFIQAHRVDEIARVPVVAPPPGSDVYLEALSFSWRPILRLKRGETYRLMISSRDVQHGFSLVARSRSVNFQVLPGFVTAFRLTPEEVGEFPIICNEFCGLGHHLMVGRVVVTD